MLGIGRFRRRERLLKVVLLCRMVRVGFVLFWRGSGVGGTPKGPLSSVVMLRFVWSGCLVVVRFSSAFLSGARSFLRFDGHCEQFVLSLRVK
jgi:hypothetical protein